MRDERLVAIAARVGTPVYVYDADEIRARFAALAGAFAAASIPLHVHYAVKANSNLAVLALLRGLGAGADIVSGGELARVLAAGFPPDAVVFSGVGKTEDELREALRIGVQVNLESAGEADAVARLATPGRDAAIGIRVNPDVTAETHPYTQTGRRGMKFGVPLDEVVTVARRVHATAGLALRSLGVHIGSQILSGEPYAAGAAVLERLVREVRAAGIDTLRSVDIGGGLGIAYTPGAAALDPADVARAVAPLHAATGLRVLLEPGRFLVGNAGLLLTRVLYRKPVPGRTILVVDAAMNDFIRPSLYGAEHPVRVVDGAVDGPPEAVDVVGPVCETGDFLALDRSLPRVEPGDVLAVGGAGAYGFTMASQYNSRPRAAEVLMDGERWGVIRARETTADLFAAERLEPAWTSAMPDS